MVGWLQQQAAAWLLGALHVAWLLGTLASVHFGIAGAHEKVMGSRTELGDLLSLELRGTPQVLEK